LREANAIVTDNLPKILGTWSFRGGRSGLGWGANSWEIFARAARAGEPKLVFERKAGVRRVPSALGSALFSRFELPCLRLIFQQYWV
jgi:hypothetical protein